MSCVVKNSDAGHQLGCQRGWQPSLKYIDGGGRGAKKNPHTEVRGFFLDRKNNDDGDYKKKTIHSLLSLDTRLVCESNLCYEAKRK